MIVDSCAADYAAVMAAGDANGIRCSFLNTGAQAMLQPGQAGNRAWMINLQLPDMTGLALYRLMEPSLGKTPLLMVDDQYDAAREVSVLELGHPYYAAKPLDGRWVGHLRPDAS